MITYSVLLRPEAYSEASKTATALGKQASNDEERKEKLKQADASVRKAYDLLWNQQDYDGAVTTLLHALRVQRQLLGKHDKQVGWSCSFLGTALWLSGDDKEGLKYFLEARLIFSKCGKGNIMAIEQSIVCILGEKGLNTNEIDAFHSIVKQTINHELQGDSYKKQGLLKQARAEYCQAKAGFQKLTQIIQ
eukprot:scaffold1319_cov126-Cylindrotheca_fusiformis.AAC.10